MFRLGHINVRLSIKAKPYTKPLMITVFLFGRHLPQGFKSWAIKHAFDLKATQVRRDA